MLILPRVYSLSTIVHLFTRFPHFPAAKSGPASGGGSRAGNRRRKKADGAGVPQPRSRPGDHPPAPAARLPEPSISSASQPFWSPGSGCPEALSPGSNPCPIRVKTAARTPGSRVRAAWPFAGSDGICRRASNYIRPLRAMSDGRHGTPAALARGAAGTLDCRKQAQPSPRGVGRRVPAEPRTGP